MEKKCKSAKELVSFESVGLSPELDERARRYVSELQNEEGSDDYRFGYECNSYSEFMTYVVRQNRLNLGDHHNMYRDTLDEPFSIEEWEAIDRALIDAGYFRPEFSFDAIEKVLDKSTLAVVLYDASNYLYEYDEVVDCIYEYADEKAEVDESIIDSALKKLLTPAQYHFLKWASELDLAIIRSGKAGGRLCLRSAEDGECWYAENDGFLEEIDKAIDDWSLSNNFYAVLIAAIVK